MAHAVAALVGAPLVHGHLVPGSRAPALHQIPGVHVAAVPVGPDHGRSHPRVADRLAVLADELGEAPHVAFGGGDADFEHPS